MNIDDISTRRAEAMKRVRTAMDNRIKWMTEERKARIALREIEAEECEYRFSIGKV